MLEHNVEKNKFVLSPEQRIALMEAKVERATAQIKQLAEMAKIKSDAERRLYRKYR